MIRCLGCQETFREFEEFQKHRANSAHPDVGEVYS